MKIAEIKRLAQTFSFAELQEAEVAIIEESSPLIEINGVDEGEQLTHILAALEVKKDMESNQIDINTAIRNYSQRVRNSIS